MQRRQLAAQALAGAALAVTLPFAAKAASSGGTENVVFTSDDPGHWADVADLHVPDTSISGSTLTISTPHPMTPDHFIVSHTVVLDGGVFLDRKTFTPADKPTSAHTLPAGYKGVVTVTSTCNLHDFWVKQITV